MEQASLLGEILLVATTFALVALFLTLSVLRNLPLPVSRPPRQGRTLKNAAYWPRFGEPAVVADAPLMRGLRRLIGWSGYRPIRLRHYSLGVTAAALFFTAITQDGRVLGVGFLGLILIYAAVMFKARKARARFIVQLPDALDALAQALRAGYALPHALRLVEREVTPPIKQIFNALARADQYQLTLKEAIESLEDQLNIEEWNLVAETLRIQQSLGGNIIPVLQEVAATLRDKLSVDQEVQSATASGRFSGIIIAALAPLSFVGFMLFSPSYMRVLTDTTLGVMLLALAALLELAGFLIIAKLTRIEY